MFSLAAQPCPSWQHWPADMWAFWQCGPPTFESDHPMGNGAEMSCPCCSSPKLQIHEQNDDCCFIPLKFAIVVSQWNRTRTSTHQLKIHLQPSLLPPNASLIMHHIPIHALPAFLRVTCLAYKFWSIPAQNNLLLTLIPRNRTSILSWLPNLRCPATRGVFFLAHWLPMAGCLVDLGWGLWHSNAQNG